MSTYPRCDSAGPPNNPQSKRDTILQAHSPPSSPLSGIENKRDKSSQSQSSIPRYRPYIPRGKGTVPPALHYAARSLGIMTPTDVRLEEVQRKRDAFIEALSAMPDSILLSARDVKRADHEVTSLRLALANAEIKHSERRMLFLSTMRDQHVGAHAVSATYLGILDQVLGIRDLEDVKGSEQFYTAAREEHATALAVSEAHVTQMQDAIGPRFRWLGGHGSGRDPEDPFDGFSDSDSASSDEGTVA